MKVLIAIDKFKESLTSIQASKIIANSIHSANPAFETTILPIADGGDGFAEVLKHYLKTKTVFVKSFDPLFKPLKGRYEWDAISKTAIIEMAVCSGLALLKSKDRNPLYTTTFGTGKLVDHAIKKGAKKIILGLGGSSTNDGGLGLASALGFKFYDKNGLELMPIGGALVNLHSIVTPKNKSKVEFLIASDVKNPLYGKNGAAFVYAPQKGANDAMVIELDKGLRNLAKQIKKTSNIDISKMEGMGAAGGITAMVLPFFKTTIIPGIELIIKYSHFENQLKKADLLITGEGKIDKQSFQGKVVGTLLQIAKKYNKNILLITGKKGNDLPNKFSHFPLIELSSSVSVKYSIKYAADILNKKTRAYFSSPNQFSQKS